MPKNFESLNKDSNRYTIHTGTGIKTADVTPTPLTSPLTYVGTGNIFTLNIPENAAEVVLRPSTDLRISEDVTHATYFVIPADTTYVIGVTRTDELYLDADVDGGDLNFYFVLV